jgi:hypothetical protein
MYNYTYYDVPIIIYKNPTTKLDLIYLIISFGTIIYTFCNLFNVDIGMIIQNRNHKYIFNIILLFCSIIVIIHIIYINYILNVINIINDIYQFIFF